MKIILPLKIKAYEFNDLSEETKERVISDYIRFLLETTPYEKQNLYIKEVLYTAEKLHVPWFTPYYVYENCKWKIIKDILNNGCLFDENGNTLPIVSYIDSEGNIIKQELSI